MVIFHSTYCYITGGNGVTAVKINNDMYYLRRDAQGTITGLVEQSGGLVEEYSYDAWGRRRNPTDWTYDNVLQPQYMHRGYTMHEMLDEFGLINMNGRCYDPVVGRFLSPDIIVQNPNNTQCYNRYSYCINNPLKYSDPSGWVPVGYNNWADRLNDLNHQIRNSRYAQFCGMLDVFKKMVLGEYFAIYGDPTKPNGGAMPNAGNSINNISAVINMLVKNGVFPGFGGESNNSISEYDNTSKTDFSYSVNPEDINGPTDHDPEKDNNKKESTIGLINSWLTGLAHAFKDDKSVVKGLKIGGSVAFGVGVFIEAGLVISDFWTAGNSGSWKDWSMAINRGGILATTFIPYCGAAVNVALTVIDGANGFEWLYDYFDQQQNTWNNYGFMMVRGANGQLIIIQKK